MRLPGLVSICALALALPASCAPLSATPWPTGSGDAGAVDSASSADGASSSGSGGSADGGACAPGDVATYQPVYHPAAPAHGCADMQQISGFFDACFGVNGTAALCEKFQGTYADCASCIVTPDSAPAYGPIVNHGAFVTANVAGCIELMIASPTGAEPRCADAGVAELACAKAVQAVEGCELAACQANCNVHDSTSLDGFQSCSNAADVSGCSTYAQAAQCATPDAGGGSCGAPAACIVADFKAFYDGVVPAFCLPAPVYDAGAPLDAGGSQPDAASGD